MSDTHVATAAAPLQRRGGRLTETAARRVAYAVFGACVTLYLVSLGFEFVNVAPRSTSWGSNNRLFEIVFAIAVFAFPAVGALITRRHPRSTIGWLMLAIGVLWAWSAFADAYVLYAVVTHPGSLPNPELMGASEDWIWVPAIGLMGTFLILLFPDGHLPSPRWRVVAWVSAATTVAGSISVLFRPGPMEDLAVKGLVNPLGIEPLKGALEWLSASLILFPLCILACAVGLVVRFRRSSGVERLQLKWLATAGALVALIYLVAMAGTLGPGQSGPPPAWVIATQDVALASFGMLPLAIGVAILKHRLFGIDVVINKAVVFGSLATFITAVYVAIVVGIGSLVGRGDRPNLALSIAATAVVAVAFQPVRDRVQRFANRLVYGARATPYEVLSDFADRMGGSYDAGALLPMMARTIAQGVGASHVDVWLGIGAGLVREASWPPTVDERPTTLAASVDTVDEMGTLEGDRVVAVRHHGELLGAITVLKPPTEPITPAEDKLLDDVAAQAGLVLRNVRLIEELRSSRQRLVSTQDEERRRLERNLHDGAQQSLVSVALMLRTVRPRFDAESDTLGAALDQASEQLALAIDELRELARGIHPAILTDRGLGPAVESLAERSPVPVVLRYELEGRPDKTIEGALYFVVAEALTNVAKYAQASQVTVTVAGSSDTLMLDIVDDGVGGADRARGSGLRGLEDRVAVVDGTLEVHSPFGGGTRLACRIPIEPLGQQTDVTPDEFRPATPLGAGQ